MLKFLKFISLVMTAALVLQCSSKSNSTTNNAAAGTVPGIITAVPTEATSVSAKISADSGGQLSIGNSVQLTIPAGALNEDTEISIAKTATAPQQETLVPVANSLNLGAEGIEFNQAVTLNACYDPAVLAAKSLAEDTVQVYYVDDSGNYAAIGGNVNKGSHCVTAQLQHFSTYLVAAQILQGGNNPPVVSAPTFTPNVPMAGLPLKISSVITDYELSTVNGQVGFGQVATATLYYRIPGEPSYTQVALTPDYLDDTATRYSYKIPANRVTTAGIEYYLKATDNLGLNKLRNTTTLAIARSATGINFNVAAIIDIAAGFRRSYTVRGIDDLGATHNIDVDSFALNNGIGTAAKISPSVIQITATTANAQNYRIGSLTVIAGTFNVTSQDIRVHAGYLDHISLLSPTGVVLGATINVNANATYDFDVLGYDAFGNTSNVLPLFVLVPTPPAVNGGSIVPTGLYTAPATAVTATLVATLDGVQDSILINVLPAGPTVTVLGDGSSIYAKGLAADTSGNVFATTNMGTVVKVTPAGVVSVFAGMVGQTGYINGPANTAQFNSAQGIAVDNANNFYIADTLNDVIRKIDNMGNVTTLAGTIRGYADGTCSTAQFDRPFDVAVGIANDLYVVDRQNRVRKIDLSTCIVSTVAGNGFGNGVDGPALQSGLCGPQGLSVDPSGNIYIAEWRSIRRLDPTGTITTIAGVASCSSSDFGYVDGPVAAARFEYNYDVAYMPSGDIFITDNFNGSLRKIIGGTTVATVSPLAPTPPFAIAAFAIASDAAGALYVSDGTRILKVQ